MPATLSKRNDRKTKRPTALTGITFMTPHGELHIPSSVKNLSSFRRWSLNEPLLEKVQACFLGGEIWVETEMEELFSHSNVQIAFVTALAPIIQTADTGYLLGDRVRLTHVGANLASEPDALFVSYDAIRSGRVKLRSGKRPDEIMELEGTPEMVLEIVSQSSVTKDEKRLFDLYHLAGISEYWLVDVRRDRLRFDIYQHAATGYEPVRKSGGWLKSNVFGKSFRLTRETDPLGHPRVRVNVR